MRQQRGFWGKVKGDVTVPVYKANTHPVPIPSLWHMAGSRGGTGAMRGPPAVGGLNVWFVFGANYRRCGKRQIWNHNKMSIVSFFPEISLISRAQPSSPGLSFSVRGEKRKIHLPGVTCKNGDAEVKGQVLVLGRSKYGTISTRLSLSYASDSADLSWPQSVWEWYWGGLFPITHQPTSARRVSPYKRACLFFSRGHDIKSENKQHWSTDLQGRQGDRFISDLETISQR